MKIIDKLKQDKVTLSFEVFPPKTSDTYQSVERATQEIAALRPDFMSVTYGAGGGTSDYTVGIAAGIQDKYGVDVLAHLTCASSTREKVAQVVEELKAAGIENILALRGDIPEHADFPLPNQYKHASELIQDIRSKGDFCIGGACYPEGHPEAPSIQADIENLKRKIDSGCEFLVTQMFFDNNILYNFLYKLLKQGIQVPVTAGIMPVTNAGQIANIVKLSGNTVPPRFKAIVERFADKPEALRQAGIAYATDQIIDLVANGVNNIHIYTMNKPAVAGKILDNLSEIYVR